MTSTRPVTLDDWPALKDLLRGMPERARRVVPCTEEELEMAIVSSLHPSNPFRLQVLLHKQLIIGYAVAVLQPGAPVVNVDQQSGPVHCYIHSIYVRPGSPPEAGKVLVGGLEDFARQMGALTMYGNAQPGAPVKAWARKYGARHYQVLVKEVTRDGFHK